MLSQRRRRPRCWRILPEKSHPVSLTRQACYMTQERWYWINIWPPAFPYFYRRTHMDGIELVEVEREVFGIDHAEAGTRLAERWSLPRNLIDAISHHHMPERGSADPVLTPLVYLADLIVSRFLVGQELERHNTHALPFCLRKAGIKPEQLPGVIDRIPLDFHTPSQP